MHYEKSFSQYMDEVKTHKLLTHEEEKELGKRIEKNDKEAFDKLVNHNLKLVIKIAKEYNRDGIEMMDLVQEGNIGLMTAAKKYDYSKGYRFSTYATWWIKQGINKAIDSNYTIKKPTYLVKNSRTINKAIAQLIKEHNRYPTEEEISEQTGIDVEKVREIITEFKGMLSIDNQIKTYNSNQKDSMKFLIENDNAKDPYKEAYRKELTCEVREMLNSLGDIERDVIEKRYALNGNIEPLTLEDISDKKRISRERVRQIEKKALRKMRHPSRLYDLEKILKGVN